MLLPLAGKKVLIRHLPTIYWREVVSNDNK